MMIHYMWSHSACPSNSLSLKVLFYTALGTPGHQYPMLYYCPSPVVVKLRAKQGGIQSPLISQRTRGGREGDLRFTYLVGDSNYSLSKRRCWDPFIGGSTGRKEGGEGGRIILRLDLRVPRLLRL